MKCPNDGSTMFEQETGRYCPSCGAVYFYFGKDEPETEYGIKLWKAYNEKNRNKSNDD